MYIVDAYYNLFNYNSYNNFKVSFEKVVISRFSNGEREPNIDDGSNENRQQSISDDTGNISDDTGNTVITKYMLVEFFETNVFGCKSDEDTYSVKPGDIDHLVPSNIFYMF